MIAQIMLPAADLWSIAGWTMVHFLWLGALVGAAAAVCRLLLRRASANVRYAAIIVWLLALAVLPIGTAAWLVTHSPTLNDAGGGGMVAAVSPTTSAPIAIPSTNETAEQIIELHTPSDAAEPAAVDRPSFPAAVADSSIANLAPNPPSSFWLSTLDPRLSTLTAFIPYLPWLWLIGTPVTFALLLTGIVGTRRLGRASQLIADGPIAEMLGRLAASLKITRRVTVAACERIAAPVLIGIVRPMILLPPAALTGWSPDEIEMVLLHELAHVRRWDNLVNLLQRCVESLLFFHPAVWLLSSWVRREREACCDALVVGRTNRPHAYAEMLVALAAQMPRSVLFHPAASSAMAAGPLRSRIRRILQLEDDPMLVSGKSLILVLGSLLVAATLAVVYVPAIGNAEEAAAENLEGTDKEAVEEKSTEQARQETESLNNMRRIALAILNYQAAHGTLPPQAICDANGRPLLSWRVAILPFMEDESELFSEFRRDEPWDSEHNRKLIARMPAPFRNPMLMEPGKTNYLAVVGSDCAFNGSPRGFGLRQITDGTSNTINVVEANADQAVEWTKPEDWNFDRGNALRGLGSAWPDGWHAAYVDGHIKKLARDASPDAIGIAFTRNGGEQKSLAESAGRRVASEGAMAEMEGGGLRYGVASVAGEPATAADLAGPPRAVTQSVNNPFAGPPGSSPPASNPFAASREWDYGPRSEDFGPNADAAERRQFPSLEEQKLADLGYKRLGLELEAIGAEELKRVRALGFDGGVKVTQTNGSLQPTDILVGLHVWPTTSIQDVADVLSRADLAELTPLKYYVLRQELASSPQHPNGVAKDFVRTGRIPVQLDRTPRRGWGGGESSYEFPATPQRPATGEMPARRSTTPSRPAETAPNEPVSRPTDSKSSATVAPKRAEEFTPPNLFPTTKASTTADETLPWEEPTTPTPRPASNDPGPAPGEQRLFVNPETSARATNTTAPAAPPAARSPVDTWVSERLQREADEEAQRRRNLDATGLPATADDAPALSESESQPALHPHPLPQNRSTMGSRERQLDRKNLRYDGKPFETWRDTWKTELSTKQRLEAVKALAAFGRAGYGKEAAEAILDVAGEYDFSIIDSSDEGKLKDTVIDELAPLSPMGAVVVRPQTLVKYWVPDLAARLEKEPKKWKDLALSLIYRVQTGDERTLAALRSLAASSDAELRRMALSALVYSHQALSGGPQPDDTTRKLIDDALQSKDPATVRSTLQLLTYVRPSSGYPGGFGGGGGYGGGKSPPPPTPQLRYRPAMFPQLLFHADESVRREARSIARCLDDKDTPQVVEQLVGVLNDKSRNKDHIEAIRALAALGKKASTASPELLDILKSSDDQATLAAAFMAALYCTGKPVADDFANGRIIINDEVLEEIFGTELTDDERRALLIKTAGPDPFGQKAKEFTQRLASENAAIFPPTNENLGGGGFF